MIIHVIELPEIALVFQMLSDVLALSVSQMLGVTAMKLDARNVVVLMTVQIVCSVTW